MTENVESLTKRAVSAAKWNYLGNGFKVMLQFLIGVWLARLLGPEAFGVVAIAWLMIGVGKLISDFGFSAALIQRPDLTDRDVGYIFTIQVLIGFSLSLLGFLFTSQIAAFFNHAPAEPVIAVMAWLFLIQAIGQTTTAALNRALRFKFSQMANVATYMLGYVGIGLPMAYLGYGAWSLVAAQMAQAVAYTVIVLVKSRVAIRPRLRPSKPGLFTFGGKVIGANLCSYAILNLDNFIVGKYLGVAQLGVYNRAMTLLGTPNGVIVTSLQSVLFSAASREQNNPESTKRSFLAATEFVGLVCLPIFLTVAVVPEVVVLGIYGEAWSAAISPLVPLALAMPVHAFLAVIGPVLMAINRTELEVYAQLVALLISAPLLFFAGMQSLDALAWAVFIAHLIRWITLLVAARFGMCVTLFEVSVALQRGLVLGLLVAGTVALTDYFLSAKNDMVNLLILMATASLALLFFLRALGPYIGRGALFKLLLERNALPCRVTYWLRLN
ncbi:lipopolysaccharide biosynthesis protein [Thauera mechernichensis]|uniref:Lipopolysaccharide biosynthesis protein n=1 Tax=Thauera mechernichensis TaxID=82788 RepID=A0ABW3WDS1_9RHOO|nr:lipopolysaccharide biosynthesis protein [Thauera mechernichensis]MDG3064869.1 lipopolysaccharide biosynthesis protein [Thauera mechernichensis]